MTKIKCIRGDTLNVAIMNTRIELDDGSFYVLNAEDKITFSICMPRKKVLIEKSFPTGGIEVVDNETLIMTFNPKETESLQCLNYDFDCKIDLKGKGTEIYTIAKGEIQVYETATKLAGGI